MNKELPKIYDPKEVESKLYRFWMENGYFHTERDPEKKPFTIVMPPRFAPTRKHNVLLYRTMHSTVSPQHPAASIP